MLVDVSMYNFFLELRHSAREIEKERGRERERASEREREREKGRKREGSIICWLCRVTRLGHWDIVGIFPLLWDFSASEG